MKAYNKGFIDGMTAFAHWKNGKRYVGTKGFELKEAIKFVEQTFNFNPVNDPLPKPPLTKPNK